MSKVTVSRKRGHWIYVGGKAVGYMGIRNDQWTALILDVRTNEYIATANHPEYSVASAWARQDLESMTIEQVIDRYHPKPVSEPTLPADEFAPSLKYTLTLREDEGDGNVEHITIAECDSKANMVQAVERIGDDAYKHYVTVWDYQWCADGDILENSNAQEWIEEATR
jgi:hypothetical protein